MEVLASLKPFKLGMKTLKDRDDIVSKEESENVNDHLGLQLIIPREEDGIPSNPIQSATSSSNRIVESSPRCRPL